MVTGSKLLHSWRVSRVRFKDIVIINRITVCKQYSRGITIGQSRFY